MFFANSGTEANEAAIKLVRRSQGPERPVMVAAEHSFHGRTMGALALTGKESIREPFGPFGLTVRFVPFGDAAALRAAVGADCAAVFLEPSLGEGGVVPAPEGYLRAAREACDEAGALLVIDEIQSAIGRTGTWFAHQAEGVRPDVLTLAKGLGGGLPIGACVGFGGCGAASPRAITARPSAATRSPAPPPWRCSTRSSATDCWPRSRRWGSAWWRASRRCGTRWWPACAAAGCGWPSR